MEKDLPVETDVSTESEVVTDDVKTDKTDDTSEDTEQEDYRAKLNIQNRFLEKEGYKFIDGKWVKPQSSEKIESQSASKPVESGLSLKDWKALQDVHDDDVEEVVEYAKFKKITVAEAKKSGVISTLLKEKEEQRKTAQASNTGPARRGSVKVSDEEIVRKAEQGQVPEDPEVLAQARANLQKKK